MIYCFVIDKIYETLRRLETEGFENTIWTTKDIRRRTDLNYSFLYRMERKRIIRPAERAQNGRLIWAPIEIYETLKQIEIYLKIKAGYYE